MTTKSAYLQSDSDSSSICSQESEQEAGGPFEKRDVDKNLKRKELGNDDDEDDDDNDDDWGDFAEDDDSPSEHKNSSQSVAATLELKKKIGVFSSTSKDDGDTKELNLVSRASAKAKDHEQSESGWSDDESDESLKADLKTIRNSPSLTPLEVAASNEKQKATRQAVDKRKLAQMMRPAHMTKKSPITQKSSGAHIPADLFQSLQIRNESGYNNNMQQQLRDVHCEKLFHTNLERHHLRERKILTHIFSTNEEQIRLPKSLPTTRFRPTRKLRSQYESLTEESRSHRSSLSAISDLSLIPKVELTPKQKAALDDYMEKKKILENSLHCSSSDRSYLQKMAEVHREEVRLHEEDRRDVHGTTDLVVGNCAFYEVSQFTRFMKEAIREEVSLPFQLSTFNKHASIDIERRKRKLKLKFFSDSIAREFYSTMQPVFEKYRLELFFDVEKEYNDLRDEIMSHYLET